MAAGNTRAAGKPARVQPFPFKRSDDSQWRVSGRFDHRFHCYESQDRIKGPVGPCSSDQRRDGHFLNPFKLRSRNLSTRPPLAESPTTQTPTNSIATERTSASSFSSMLGAMNRILGRSVLTRWASARGQVPSRGPMELLRPHRLWRVSCIFPDINFTLVARLRASLP